MPVKLVPSCRSSGGSKAMVLQRAEAPPRAINFDGENYVPTIARVGPYRLFFYAGDRDEPPHVHVERDDSVAKFWLDPVRLQRAVGFRAAELRQIAPRQARRLGVRGSRAVR